MKIGDYVKFNNNIIAKIMKIEDDKVKLRCISSCKGRYSSLERIGKSYTYQRWTTLKILYNNSFVITTEHLLEILFGVDNQNKIKKRKSISKNKKLELLCLRK
jgi:hypothetical protein